MNKTDTERMLALLTMISVVIDKTSKYYGKLVYVWRFDVRGSKYVCSNGISDIHLNKNQLMNLTLQEKKERFDEVYKLSAHKQKRNSARKTKERNRLRNLPKTYNQGIEDCLNTLSHCELARHYCEALNRKTSTFTAPVKAFDELQTLFINLIFKASARERDWN